MRALRFRSVSFVSAAGLVASVLVGCTLLDLSELSKGSGGSGGASSATTTSSASKGATGPGVTSTGSATGSSSTGAGVGCGDGSLGGQEECDDGNTTSGDGCSATCDVECTGSASFKFYKDPTSHHCYAFGNATDSWVDSKSKCDGLGGSGKLAFYLGIMRTAAEKQISQSHTQNTEEFWVGASPQGGTWKWLDGTTVDSSLWGPGEPSSGSSTKCAAVSFVVNGSLLADSCFGSSQALCERGPDGMND